MVQLTSIVTKAHSPSSMQNGSVCMNQFMLFLIIVSVRRDWYHGPWISSSHSWSQAALPHKKAQLGSHPILVTALHTCQCNAYRCTRPLPSPLGINFIMRHQHSWFSTEFSCRNCRYYFNVLWGLIACAARVVHRHRDRDSGQYVSRVSNNVLLCIQWQ